jgi:hypothetical protein
MRSPAVTLVLILASIAAVSVALPVVGFAANLGAANIGTVFTGIASVLVAVFGSATAPWLASRSGRGSVVCSAVGLAAEVVAASLLVTSPPSNSNLWVPINLGRFGGVIVAVLGLALSLHAALLRRFGWGRALALVAANIIAVVIGVAIADWETRVQTFY